VKHFWQEAEDLCRVAAGSDLAGAGCYVIDAADLPAGTDFAACKARAFTAGNLSRTMEAWLTACGRWTGPGFCTIVQRSEFPTYNAACAIALHELAHHLGYLALANQVELAHRWGVAVESPAAAWSAAFAPIAAPVVPWEGHGLAFIRASLHIAFRARVLHSWLGIEALRVAGPSYGLSTCFEYADAIGDERTERAAEPITTILATEPPAEFTDLFNRDVAAFHAATETEGV